MNAAQVRAKARAAMKRREEEIEQEEIEGGEINLIPYLDIVTNLMLFLLASITAGLILGQLNTTLPDKGQSQGAMKDNDPDKSPNEKPLKLVVSVTKGQILVWSISGLEGTLDNPKAKIPRKADQGKEKPIPAFDYQLLNDTLYSIARTRWNGKERKLPTYQAVLMADGDIPYGTIIATMDAMRCRFPAAEQPGKTCLFPADKKAVEEAQKLVGPPPNDLDSLLQRTGLFHPERVKFNPDEHSLFHDILFSTGFE